MPETPTMLSKQLAGTATPKQIARLEIEQLLESNGDRRHRNRQSVLASMEEDVRLAAERRHLLALYRKLGGNPEPFEMEGAEIERTGAAG